MAVVTWKCLEHILNILSVKSVICSSLSINKKKTCIWMHLVGVIYLQVVACPSPMLVPSMLVTGATPKSPLVMITSGDRKISGWSWYPVGRHCRCGKNVEKMWKTPGRIWQDSTFMVWKTPRRTIQEGSDSLTWFWGNSSNLSSVSDRVTRDFWFTRIYRIGQYGWEMCNGNGNC